MTHTPEPWHTGNAKFDNDRTVFARTCGIVRRVATNEPSYYMQPDDCAANAARIVACVNALAGIPDPAAFVKAAEGLAEVVGSLYGSENDNLSPCYCVHAGGRIIQCDRCRLYAALAAFRATTTTKEPTNEA